MVPSHYQSLIRLALVGALAAALGLAACGRKGDLELPPGAAPAKKGAPGAPDPEPRRPSPFPDLYPR